MKNTLFTLIALVTIVLFLGCGPKISAKDEASFKASKAKMEEKLNAVEQVTLEKAFRALLVKAMTDKFKDADEAKGKSIDALTRSYVDGKTYSGIVDAAEDFIKLNNKEKIVQAKKEVDSLNKLKVELQAQTKALDQFKITKMEITQDQSFDSMVPYLDVTFLNGTGDELIAEQMTRIDIFAKSTGKLLAALGTGGTFKDDEGIKPKATYELHEMLPVDARAHAEKIWATAKYPIKDFAVADLVIKVYPTLITTRKGGKIERPKALEQIDKELQSLDVALKALENAKGTLDEFELTK